MSRHKPYCSGEVRPEQTGQDTVELPGGHHSFPFMFIVPNSTTLPPSYEGIIGHVRYSLTAIVVRPRVWNKKTTQLINIMSLLDLNSLPENLMEPSKNNGQKTICCCCCESNPITACVTTERKGYVAGDTVVFNAEVVNGSRRTMNRLKGQLIMMVTFKAEGRSKSFTNKLERKRHGSLKAGASYVFRNERLTIPPVPPSYMRGCNIIDVRYYVQIVVVPAGPALNLRVDAEIVIGSIPLREVASRYGVTIPSAPSVLDSNSAPTGLYDETTLRSIPQVSYAESVFGTSRMGAKMEGCENGTEVAGFVPSYTYYKWNQQDTADMFTVKS